MDVKFIVEVTIDGVKRNLSYEEARQLYNQLNTLFGSRQVSDWEYWKNMKWVKPGQLYPVDAQKGIQEWINNTSGNKTRGTGYPILMNQSSG